MISLKLTDTPGKNIIYLLKKEQVASIDQLSESEKGRVVELIDKKVKKFQFSKEDKLIFLSVIDDSEASPSNLEKTRKTANKIFQEIIEWKI
jgi:hypothetical protein